MTTLSSAREEFVRKRKKALAKLSSSQEEFLKKEREVRADLEEAGRIWKELDERFRWWQSLP